MVLKHFMSLSFNIWEAITSCCVHYGCNMEKCAVFTHENYHRKSKDAELGHLKCQKIQFARDSSNQG